MTAPDPARAPDGAPDGLRDETAERASDASRIVTWAGLLARWMEFARAAVALPTDDEGQRWRSSVVPIISLHAVTMALGEIELLPEAERPVAEDRAAVVIADANVALRAAWRGEPMPESILQLRADAKLALEIARYVGAVELIWAGPGVLDMPALDWAGGGDQRRETLCIAPPGTPMMPGEPIAWWIGGRPLALDGCVAQSVAVPRQVYRMLDPAGRALRDLVVPLTGELPAGMPLLVPLLEQGEPVGQMPADSEAWRRLHRAAISEGGVPVEIV